MFGPCFVVLSSFAIIALRKRELVALFYSCSCCCVTISGLGLFLAVPWVGLWSVIVAFPGACILTCVLLLA